MNWIYNMEVYWCMIKKCLVNWQNELHDKPLTMVVSTSKLGFWFAYFFDTYPVIRMDAILICIFLSVAKYF